MGNPRGRTLPSLTAIRKDLLSRQWFTSVVLPALPRRLRWALRKVYFLPIDAVDRMKGRRENMVPRKSEIFTGSVDDFKATGEALADRLVEYGCLAPDSHVLDVGSGMGRLAAALTTYLGPDGSYHGLDIVPAGIDWCNRNIAANHPGFHFTLADIYNKEYNPKGRSKASEYTFPYDGETFDLVVLTSVFTHMLPPDVERYFAEISRVLRKGGKIYATYSLINEESQRRMLAGESSLWFRYRTAPCWYVDSRVPELAVGYDESYIRDLHQRHHILDGYTVRYGAWSGGRDAEFSQDIVVAAKE